MYARAKHLLCQAAYMNDCALHHVPVRAYGAGLTSRRQPEWRDAGVGKEPSLHSAHEGLCGRSGRCQTSPPWLTASNPAAKAGVDTLPQLRGAEMHLTHEPGAGDETGLRKLGISVTTDAEPTSQDYFLR